MKNQRDKLHQYQKRITILTDRETDIARQMLAKGNRDKALLALRRKRYQESLLAQTDAQLEQLEKLTSNVEFALIQKDVVFGLQQGTKVLQEIHREMGGIENVEKLMGETADAIAYQQVRSCQIGCESTYCLSYLVLTFWLRKLAISWAGGYRIRTRTKSRTNLQRWRRRWLERKIICRRCQTPTYQRHKSEPRWRLTPGNGRKGQPCLQLKGDKLTYLRQFSLYIEYSIHTAKFVQISSQYIKKVSNTRAFTTLQHDLLTSSAIFREETFRY